MGNRRIIENISLEYLRECFILDEDEGCLIWKVRPVCHFRTAAAAMTINARYSGKRAGSGVVKTKALKVQLSGKFYLVHRIIYALYHGIELRDVPVIVDHIDGDDRNNRPVNMRGATHTQSVWNRGVQTNTPHGFKGVYLGANGKWTARIKHRGKTIHLGTFSTREEAGAAHIAAAKAIRGEFFREATQAAA
ncbi:HNH endonuclease [Rhizobium leguminosarum]